MALIALLLLPLLAVAGLAVDLGGWYARAAQIQRAADAAALSGVALLAQSETLAAAEARRVASLNGFTDGVDGITVAVQRVEAQKLQVSITDPNIAQFITGPFRDDVRITRVGTAERVMPVPMGSPRNYLGTNDLLANSAHRERFALAMNGYCTPREQGDRITARSDASNQNTGSRSFVSCTPGSPGHVQENPEYSPEGYFYAVEIPESYTGGPIQIQIYDGAMCEVTNSIGNNTAAPRDFALQRPFDTRIRLRTGNIDPLLAPVITGADHTLPGGTKTNSGNTICSVNSTGNSVNPGVGTNGVTCTGNRWAFCWRTLHPGSLNVEPGQIIYIQMQALVPPAVGHGVDQEEGVNSFSLRVASSGGTFTPCSGDPADAAPGSQPPFNANCVKVYGLTHLGVFANISGASASFYLADIGSQYNGKQLEVVLWDAGEGALDISLIQPNLVPATFDWQVLCLDASDPPCPGENTPSAPNGFGVHTGQTNIPVSGTGTQAGPNRRSQDLYNGRFLRLTVDLPDNIATAYGGRTWWRIRYVTCSGSGCAAQDRTTWSVSVTGDPVRLVPNP